MSGGAFSAWQTGTGVPCEGPGARDSESPPEEEPIARENWVRFCILSPLREYENESVRENELRAGRQRRDRS